MRVLGIDPGLTRCGVGVVEGSVGRPLSLVDVGVVRTAAEMPIEERLCLIAAGLEEWLDAESNLHWDLRARGHQLYLEPAACTHHFNYSRVSAWLPATFFAARTFAARRTRGWSFGSPRSQRCSPRSACSACASTRSPT